MNHHFEEHISVLNKGECEWIKSLCTDFSPSEVTYNNDDSTRNLNNKFRSSKTCFVELSEEQRDRLTSMVSFLGIHSLPIKREIQLLEYTEGDFFAKHKDGPKRYKTLLVQLSDENEYGGGELYVDNLLASKKQGSIIIFDSNTYHQLDKVTSGKRYVLVIWLLKEHFEIKNNLI